MNEEILRLKELIKIIINNNGIDSILECFSQDYPDSDSIEELNNYIEDEFEPEEVSNDK